MRRRLAIIVVALAFSTVLLNATTTPIDGYELSLYRAVPLSFISISVIFVCGGSFALGRTESDQIAAVGISTLAITTLAALPLIRGYHYFGSWDALTHWGYAKDVMIEAVPLRLLLYPAGHILGQIISSVAGIKLPTALMTIPAAFVVVFILTLPAISTQFNGRGEIGVVALFGCWLAPIISIKFPVLQFVPATLGVLFSCFVFYIAIRYLNARSWRFSLLLMASLTALLLYHPEYLALVLILWGIITAILRLPTNSKDHVPKNTAIPLIVGGIGLLWWISNRPIFGIIPEIIASVKGTGTGSSISGKSTALSSVGGSLAEVAGKVLLPKLVLILVVGVLAVLSLIRVWKNKPTESDRLLLPFVVAGVCLLLPFGILVAVGEMNQAMRMLALGLVIVNLTISIGLFDGFNEIGHPAAKYALTTIAIIGILFATPALFQSQYVYQPNPQMTSGADSAYEWTLRHRGDTTIGSVRHQVDRYYATQEGTINSKAGITVTPARNVTADFSGDRGEKYYLPSHFNSTSRDQLLKSGQCLMLLERDKKIEAKLFDGRSYTMSDFNRFEQSSSTLYTSGTGSLHC